MSVDGVSVGKATDIIFETVAQPIRGASLFYALYWLVEIEGIEAAAFDFQRLRDRYREGFYWYGIYSIARELSHINHDYLVDGFQVADHHQELIKPIEFMDELIERRRLGSPNLERHARSLVDDELGDLAVRYFLLAGEFADSRPIDTLAGEREVEDMLIELDVIGGFEDPRPFIRMVNQVFDNAGFLEFGDDIREQLDAGRGELPAVVRNASPGSPEAQAFAQASPTRKARLASLSGWRAGDFNGPGWLGVTRHLLRRDDLSATAWVDQCWALEHNNANWLNKMEYPSFELDVAREFRPHFENGVPREIPPLDVLVGLLDANQDGDMEVVFDVAEVYDDSVGVSLRRLRRQVGV